MKASWGSEVVGCQEKLTVSPAMLRTADWSKRGDRAGRPGAPGQGEVGQEDSQLTSTRKKETVEKVVTGLDQAGAVRIKVLGAR